MIIACVIMLVLSFKQSAQIRELQQEISAREKWIEKNFSNANHEFFQDLQKRADDEIKKQALQPAFFEPFSYKSHRGGMF